MLPHRRNGERQEGDQPRPEFEVRVIGEGPADDSPRPGGEVEIGLRIGGGPPAVLLEEEERGPVHRLETDAPAILPRARPMSEAGPAAPYELRHDHHPKRRSLAWWTVWMAAGTCAVAVAAVAGLMMSRKTNPPPSEESVAFAQEITFSAEKAYFLENTPALTREAESLLERYATAKTAADVLPLVRDAARVKERLELLWQPLGGLSKSQPAEVAILDDEARPALVLSTTAADFSRLEAVFVREDGHLKLDWEASFGIGEAQLGELRKSATVVKGAKVRVYIQPGGFYTPEFPEEDFHSYQLLDAGRDEFVWAFVRRGTRTAAVLEAELNESSVLLEKAAEVQATLRISGPLREGVNLFEITDMLHKGWVTP